MRRGQHGSALVWALLATLTLATASALVASSLARRASIVRLAVHRAAQDDLAQAAAALVRVRSGDASFTGPERVVLAGGVLIVRRDATGRVVAEVER